MTANRKRYAEMQMPADGDTLPLIDVVHLADGSKRSLGDLLVERCSLLQFYQSSCPGCEKIAKEWSGQNPVVGNHVLPLIWLAIDPNDTAAASFHRKYNLTGEAVGVLSEHDAIRMRAKYTPAAYLVSSGLVVLASMQGLPVELDSLPENTAKFCAI